MNIPIGKNKSITVIPLGVLGVGVEESRAVRMNLEAPSFSNEYPYLEKRTWAAGAIPMGAPIPSQPTVS